MSFSKLTLSKYRGVAIAKSEDNTNIFYEILFKENSFKEFIEALEQGKAILTSEGFNFIKEFYGFEVFLSKVDSYQGTNLSKERLVSGLKWLIQKLKANQGVDIKEAQKFALDEKVKVISLQKYKDTPLAKGRYPFGERHPEVYTAEHFVDIVTFMFFLDKLDSTEAELYPTGLDFIQEFYGWGKLVKIFDFLNNSGFIIHYKQPEEIVLWLKNLGEFSEDRFKTLVSEVELI